MKPVNFKLTLSTRLKPLMVVFLLISGTLLLQSLLFQILAQIGFDVPDVSSPTFSFHTDLVEYQEIARALLKGQGFRYQGQLTTMRPPGYPLFLAAIYAIWDQHEAVIWIQRILTASCTGWLFLICHTLTGSIRSAWIAAGLLALYAPYQLLSLTLLSDSLYAFLLLAAVYALVKVFSQPTHQVWFCLSGLLLAATTLTRPATLFLPIVLCCVFLLLKYSYKSILAFSACFLILMLPWSLRNYQVTGRLIPVASLGAYNLWAGTYASNLLYNTEAIQRDPIFAADREKLLGPGLTGTPYYYIDYQREPLLMQAAKQRILEDPSFYVRLCAERMIRVYTAFPGTRDWLVSRPLPYWLLSALHILLWILAFGGLKRCPRSVTRILLWTLLGYAFVFHSLMNVLSRYLIPWYALLLLLAAIFLESLLKQVLERTSKAGTH